MADLIPTPTISEVLKEEFMEPMHLSAYRLAKEIHVPVSRVQGILNGGRKIKGDRGRFDQPPVSWIRFCDRTVCYNVKLRYSIRNPKFPLLLS